jgi:DNA polymerase elongation subunit (family B)
MVVWIKHENGAVTRHLFEWSPTIHVYSSAVDLEKLEKIISSSEYRYLHGGLTAQREFHIISHRDTAPEEVLAVRVGKPGDLAKIANSILSIGKWKKYDIFSVDPKPAQRFLFDNRVRPMDKVRLVGDKILAIEEYDGDDWASPRLRVASLSVDCRNSIGHRSSRGEVQSVEIKIVGLDSTSNDNSTYRVDMKNHANPASFLQELEKGMQAVNPDVVITKKGDSIDFPVMMSIASSANIGLRLGRDGRNVVLRRKSITNWSYGRLLKSEAYHALQGRLHIDLGHSFIGKEGGIEGLIEISRISGIPVQDLSRLSPGSAISAIQINQSMNDGVLVPWKKNRAEDIKTGLEMVISDRGGLYLDPLPGVHKDVFELDFASLFPSIIATRNISPETMKCVCCKPISSAHSNNAKFPLDLEEAEHLAMSRALSNDNIGLMVPEIGTYSCSLKYGFLPRVVAPIISRRRELKSRMKRKGDEWDKRQNVLKWLLVTCFGYTGYRNARFGRIECHEAICAWSREILLDAKDLAEEDGWRCIHAIVDSIWLVDNEGRTSEEQRSSIRSLMSKIECNSGIRIELEDFYKWIAFIPNKKSGIPSLTKYFAQGEKGWKIRGIEIRQHSTCNWIRKMQTDMLKNLQLGPSEKIIRQTIGIFFESVSNLTNGEVPLTDLVISRRVRKRPEEYRVSNLTLAALLRGKLLDQEDLLGRKTHFVVVNGSRGEPVDRIKLRSEINSNCSSSAINRDGIEFYKALALRASLSILSPFGITEDILLNGGLVQTTIDEWSAG